MEITTGFVLQIIMYLITIGIFVGRNETQHKYVTEQLKRLEAKQDKHNSVVERLTKCEAAVSSAHHRIDEMRAAK